MQGNLKRFDARSFSAGSGPLGLGCVGDGEFLISTQDFGINIQPGDFLACLEPGSGVEAGLVLIGVVQFDEATPCLGRIRVRMTHVPAASTPQALYLVDPATYKARVLIGKII